ncbi:MAG: hypothetical protein KDD67_12280 [Ignavibacteriae bacterium]|nr:hypothetical protein [Ignavibacteriota bacterium]MCB9217209.1 hypothetical protein [Ignavibacteria bacterium]
MSFLLLLNDLHYGGEGGHERCGKTDGQPSTRVAERLARAGVEGLAASVILRDAPQWVSITREWIAQNPTPNSG